MSVSPGSSMRTPRRRVAGLGSARSGTGHFWLQRLTAIGNLLLILIALPIVIAAAGQEQAQVVAIIGHPLVAIVLLLLLFSICFHMRIGMQVVIEDYVHTEGLKVLALIANTFFTIAVGSAGAFAVLKISFGG
ncbi:succinate dehydrogenase, hydrophobic membrane anchor protein [Ancylobacter polymorphus]|jgi:succinate dehydrogenase / fumarate reductase membrane anchor subunit|uniref:Succinate dehydrogenase hydrophobic membrane anchor subunit n=1 Tax=Ancylobacter polymorphus TaxID=223390 RepID=A0ABU0BF47_9HYPH|nr:succinate dehydrogenase, hydrophobic membrane anchor protein [Ancylobacter polymorphus]MDQ0304441.1 succinate dehydrogenase / fumarate reductase membrane anchor subunit [Ancylobacter polymorphus]MPT23680.1 succinate dehydrogenase, hydrophobic membrane anchor protein [Starkeya sp.]